MSQPFDTLHFLRSRRGRGCRANLNKKARVCVSVCAPPPLQILWNEEGGGGAFFRMLFQKKKRLRGKDNAVFSPTWCKERTVQTNPFAARQEQHAPCRQFLYKTHEHQSKADASPIASCFHNNRLYRSKAVGSTCNDLNTQYVFTPG